MGRRKSRITEASLSLREWPAEILRNDWPINSETGGRFDRNLHLARYAGKTLCVLFDEPENHLHESTLVKFYDLIYKYSRNGTNFVQEVQELATRADVTITKKQLEALATFSRKHVLASAFVFVTHSKLLIRRNLVAGQNILLSNGQAERLSGTGSEAKLREAGVSQVDERILFVEGQTDKELLASYFGDHQIEVRPLTGKDSVCTVFEGFANIDPHDRHPGFAFLIDKDSGLDVRYERLKERYPTQWSEHVLLLNRVELENYLLEPVLFRAALLRILDKEIVAQKSSELTVDSILAVLKEAAAATREQQKQNYLASALKAESLRYFPIPKARDIPIDNLQAFKASLSGIFSTDRTAAYQQRLEELFDVCENRFSDENWNLNWSALCKGKIVLPRSCKALADRLGVPGLTGNFIRFNVELEAARNEDIELTSILKQILTMVHAS